MPLKELTRFSDILALYGLENLPMLGGSLPQAFSIASPSRVALDI